MSPPEFEIDRFEQVRATSGTALLRLQGRWRAEQRERLSPPLLLVHDGRRTHRLSALAGPDEVAPLATPDGSFWRVAYAAPLGLVTTSGAAFALDTGRGGLIDLPRPTAHVARLPRQAPVAQEAEPAPAEGARSGERAAKRAEQLERDERRRQRAVARRARRQHTAAQAADDGALPGASRARHALPRGLPARRRPAVHSLPAETIVGFGLLAGGITAAALLIVGVVRVVLAG